MCFMSQPKPPAPPKLPPQLPEPARATDQGVIDARNDQMQRLRQSRGSTSTILAGGNPSGMTGAAISGGKTLLGA